MLCLHERVGDQDWPLLLFSQVLSGMLRHAEVAPNKGTNIFYEEVSAVQMRSVCAEAPSRSVDAVAEARNTAHPAAQRGPTFTEPDRLRYERASGRNAQGGTEDTTSL